MSFVQSYLHTDTELMGRVPTELNLFIPLMGVAYGDGRGLVARRSVAAGLAADRAREGRALEALAYRAAELGFDRLAEAILADAERWQQDERLGTWRLIRHCRQSWAITLHFINAAWHEANQDSRNGVSPRGFDFDRS